MINQTVDIHVSQALQSFVDIHVSQALQSFILDFGLNQGY
jgi:hypothetical protein